MSHNLNEGRMFYTGEKPWHGIGIELSRPATAKEAIQASRLDYVVETEEVKTKGGVIIPNKMATVRRDKNIPLGVVGTGYRVVQNTEAFGFFDTIVGEGQAIYHTAGALGDGERIWILAKLPKDLVLAKEDVVEKYLVLTNSHDGKSSLRMYFTPIRVVCQNTLNASMAHGKGEGIAIRHTGNIRTKVDEARRLLGVAVKYYDEFENMMKQLVDFQMDDQSVQTYFDDLLFTEGKDKDSTRLQNQKVDLLGLYESGKGNQIKGVRHTAWAAYNAVTEYADHYRTIKGVEEDPSKRLKNVWFGSGAQLKGRAFHDIMKMVTL